CIHKMVLDPRNSDTLYMQYHGGVFKSSDGAEHWQAIESGLPGNFGFPMAITADGLLFIAPLKSDEHRYFPEGRSAIYKSRDGGTSWQESRNGLPEQYFAGVLRDALAVDSCRPTGVYFGTTAGDMFYSRDGGESWQQLPGRLPRVQTVRVMSCPA
ncbi:MAG: exo-alpha-sialidase, partial [Phycisphaerae bacterium]|nr:exo-alpha-sialidase [Phycisphaerae bacterium]MDW8261914.1 hypothetical protein [Phycisphaerales bacterium]